MESTDWTIVNEKKFITTMSNKASDKLKFFILYKEVSKKRANWDGIDKKEISRYLNDKIQKEKQWLEQ
jgi:hypothetical protein